MSEPITPEEAKKLLAAIFSDTPDPDETTAGEPCDNYPETIADKVGYAAHVLTHNLGEIGKALNRLNRLDRLLLISKNDENGLPKIITHNELRMALEPLMRVRNDINDITGDLLKAYRETKPEDKKLEMREGERSCENCGAKMESDGGT